jgi:hypothetical protein
MIQLRSTLLALHERYRYAQDAKLSFTCEGIYDFDYITTYFKQFCSDSLSFNLFQLYVFLFSAVD